MTDRSAYDPFAPPPAAPVELTERAAEVLHSNENEGAVADGSVPAGDDGATAFEPGETVDGADSQDAGQTEPEAAPTHAEHVAFIASELEAGLARKGIDV